MNLLRDMPERSADFPGALSDQWRMILFKHRGCRRRIVNPSNRAKDEAAVRDPAVPAKEIWRDRSEIIADVVVEIRRTTMGWAKVARTCIPLLEGRIHAFRKHLGIRIRMGVAELIWPVLRADGYAREYRKHSQQSQNKAHPPDAFTDQRSAGNEGHGYLRMLENHHAWVFRIEHHSAASQGIFAFSERSGELARTAKPVGGVFCKIGEDEVRTGALDAR